MCTYVRMYVHMYMCTFGTVRTFPEETHEIVRDGEDFHIRNLRNVTITVTKPCMITVIVTVVHVVTIVVLVHAIVMTWPQIEEIAHECRWSGLRNNLKTYFQ